MLGVKVEIYRYVDDSFPGFVECGFVDVWSKKHLFIEKVPVVTLENLDASSIYPQPGVIGCQIVERKHVNGREILQIETERPWHIESTSGETSFEVSANQLVEFD
ncbi:MAG: hypothetical protein M3261_08495 [Thermoproteota archaeon]|nr:hypothetical protein [Thermoproteota archaeon]